MGAKFEETLNVKPLQGSIRDYEVVGDYHSHPPKTGVNQEGFSQPDSESLRRSQEKYGKVYTRAVRTPGGDIRILNRPVNPLDRNRDDKLKGRSICPNSSPCLPKHRSGVT